MGSYTDFSVNGYGVFWDKNSINYDLMILFTEDMRVESEIDGKKTIKYVLDSKRFAERLNILGFNYQGIIDDFTRTFDSEDYFEYLEETEVPQDVDLKFFREMLRIMIEGKVHSWDLYDNLVPLEELGIEGDDVLFNYVFEQVEEDKGFYYGIPLSNPMNLLLLILDICNYEGTVKYDISEVVDNGWVEDCEFTNVARKSKENSHYIHGSTIIITEGNTDKLVLEKALHHLYPHLTDLYTFFDFKASKAQGSTSEVIRIVKSFIASRIINKTVVLLDNDTAGMEARKSLSALNIPNNIKILNYPDIDLCKDYPTLGPTGIQNMNINGLACSIEMYLGKDVLEEQDKLIPIQWKGYSEKMQQYQGCITRKDYVQDKFRRKFEKNPNDIDWSHLDQILQSVFKVYSIDKIGG